MGARVGIGGDGGQQGADMKQAGRAGGETSYIHGRGLCRAGAVCLHGIQIVIEKGVPYTPEFGFQTA
ncbi:hypothetical protein [Neisseria subflava]|uniref:hypothetical protein n=1 Tax=Neisseria subflava TaxID=28449 RepID=UPI0024A90359|nr:hypothetical protein [Neisseria subflava]